MPPRHVVVIGGSAGSIETLQHLIGDLPMDLDAAVLVVVHLAAGARSHLSEILGRRSSLPVHAARDGMPLEASHVYVAPPDRHLTVEQDHIRVVAGPRQNRHRPSIDPLFRSAARHFGDRTTAIVLSGAPGDGVAGALAVTHRGGTVIVQDPNDALFGGMPERVLLDVADATAVAADGIADLIIRRVGRHTTEHRHVPEADGRKGGRMDEPSELEQAGTSRANSESDPRAAYGCPDCGGVLLEASDGTLRRFRCRVGHEYGAEALRLAQVSALEDALWSAIRGLEESADLAERLSTVPVSDRAASSRHAEHAEDAREHADQIRQFLLRLLADPPESTEAREVVGTGAATATPVATG